MRRIGIVLAIGAAVLLLVIGAAWLLLDVNQYGGVIQARLEQQLGRKVTLGRMSLGLVPLRFQVANPTIAEDPSFGGQPVFIRAENLDVRVGLFPLLRGNVNVQSIELRQPSVELIKNRQGIWNFASLGAKNTPLDSATASSAEAADGSFALDRLQIRDGQIAVTDRQTGAPRAVYDHIDLTLLNYTAGKPFTVELGVQKILLKGEGGPFVEKSPAATPFRGTLTLNHVALDGLMSNAAGTLSGETQIVNQAGNMTAAGKMTLDGAKFNGLDVGYPIKLDYDTSAKLIDGRFTVNSATIMLGPTPLSIAGSINTNTTPANIDLNFKSGEVSIAEIARLASAFGVAFGPGTIVTGQVGVDVRARGSAAKPALSGTIAGRDLQISGKDVPQPVHVKALDLVLTPTEIRSNEFSATSGKTTVAGRFTLKQYLSDSPLVDVGLRAPNATLPEIQSIARAYGVTGLDQITGEGALNLDLKAAGSAASLNSPDALKALNGTLNLDFSPLQLKGFDMARELAVIGGFGTGSDNKNLTDLLRLTGHILIKDGVAQTDDLKAQLPIGIVSATGTANLASDNLNVKLAAVLSKAFSEKAGGTRVGGYMRTALANGAGELVIPAIVTGSLKQPKFAPDVQAFLQLQKQRLLPSLDDTRATISGIVGGGEKPSLKGILGGLFGGKKPATSALAGTSWQWTKTTMPDGTTIVPKRPDRFVLTFGADGKLTSRTDCNSLSGAYTFDGSTLSIERLAATKMFCEGSQETPYTNGLQAAASASISGDVLSIALNGATGIMSFRRN